jgi:hypothetical protein
MKIVSEAISRVYDAARGRTDRTVSGLSLRSTASALCSTSKMSGKYRRALLKARDRFTDTVPTAPTEPAVRTHNRVRGMNARQLARELTQCNNRTRLAAQKLSKLRPNSPLRPVLEKHIENLGHVKEAVTQELKYRPLKPSEKLALA